MKRTKSGKAWMHEHVTDVFVQRAKAEGWRSRAAFKLMEIDDRDHLIRPGETIVDLGAAPGGWSQLAVQRLRGNGRIVATTRSEERRVGKECRSRWSPYH